MIVVVASERDAEATGLARAWSASPAVIVTPADLSSTGWAVAFPDAGPTFVASGELHSVAEISAVLVRLPCVAPSDLTRVELEDREYAAAEMTAFLAYWLRALPCRVFNRPSPTMLLGPGWTLAEWLTRAAALGIAVADIAVTRGCRPALRADVRWVDVVGERAFGGDATMRAWSIALARMADVQLLGVGFADGDQARLAAITLRPSLENPDVVLALRQLLEGSAT